MAYVFAEGIGGLAAQKNLYDRQNIELAQADQAARQRAQDQTMANYQFAVQQQRTDQRMAAEQQMQQDSMRRHEADQARQEALGIYQWNIGRSDKATDLAQQQKNFESKLALDREAMTAQKDINQEKSALGDYSDAFQAVNEGLVTGPEQVDKLFPSLSDNQRERLKTYMATGRERVSEDWDAINNAAKAATATVQAKRMATAPAIKEGIYGFRSSRQPTAAELPALAEEQAFEMVAKDPVLKKYQALIHWDETANPPQFVPVQRQPAGYTFRNGSTGGTGIDRTRPIINNPDGTFSTEKTITVGADGKYFLIPTIVNGQQLSNDAAVASWRAGANKPVGMFNTQQEADTYAQQRSQQIGQLRSPGAVAGLPPLFQFAQTPFPPTVTARPPAYSWGDLTRDSALATVGGPVLPFIDKLRRGNPQPAPVLATNQFNPTVAGMPTPPEVIAAQPLPKSPKYYDRVRELIASGYTMNDAIRRAKMETQ